MGSEPFVSVIVPVYNDAKRLRECLQSLARQSYAAAGYEVIVVDNDSTDNPKFVTSAFPGIVYTYESRPGPAAARNKGLSLAKGEVIAFTDADARPEADWLQKGVRALLSRPGCGLVGGRIDHYFKRAGHPTAIELFSKSYFNPKKYLEERHFAAGANLFTFRRVFQAVGEFKETFAAPACEDREWGERVYARGYPMIYAEDCVVSHPVRRTWREFYRKQKALAIGNFEYEKLTRGKPENSAGGELLALFKPPLRSTASWLRQAGGAWLKLRLYLVIVFAYYLRLGVRLWMRMGGRPQWRNH